MAITTEAVLIPHIAFVTEPLRGHDLGVWLVSETIHRMLPTGIVSMWPYPMLSTAGTDRALAVHSRQLTARDSATCRLSEHFGRCGLSPAESAPDE